MPIMRTTHTTAVHAAKARTTTGRRASWRTRATTVTAARARNDTTSIVRPTLAAVSRSASDQIVPIRVPQTNTVQATRVHTGQVWRRVTRATYLDRTVKKHGK